MVKKGQGEREALARPLSSELFAEAQQYLAGGVNSPVRAFRAVGGEPPFIQRGEGAKISDVDGHEYLDFVCSWGPLILGHAHPIVVEALRQAVENGTSFGAPTVLEVTLAKLIREALPSIELVRFVNSGTEACMSAIRLARAFTGREKIVKFDGCYHGHADSFLVRAGSGSLTFGAPSSPGVPAATAAATISLPYNDLTTVEALFAREGESIAAIIVEPIAGNMGVVPPQSGFLEGLRRVTEQWGALLIFDEVITGFRICYGGAQTRYGIQPDLTCLGKVIGGGLPVGAYGGRRQVMELLSPLGPVYQAGTLSGNPLAMTAGIETLGALRGSEVYETLEARASKLVAGLAEAARRAEVPLMINQVGSMLTPFFTDTPVVDLQSALAADTGRYARFFHGMLRRGMYLPPSQFEAWFVSSAHSNHDIETAIELSERTLQEIK